MFIFSDVRDGVNTVHSWELSGEDEIAASVCLAMVKNRRSKRYGERDGNPMTGEQISEVAGFNCLEVLKRLKTIGILEEKDGMYDFKNRKISAGISGVYRIIPMTSSFFPTLVSFGSRDFICEDTMFAGKADVVRAFKNKTWREPTMDECRALQGFPETFRLPEKRKDWMHLVGNSVYVPLVSKIVESVVKTGVFGT